MAPPAPAAAASRDEALVEVTKYTELPQRADDSEGVDAVRTDKMLLQRLLQGEHESEPQVTSVGTLGHIAIDYHPRPSRVASSLQSPDREAATSGRQGSLIDLELLREVNNAFRMARPPRMRWCRGMWRPDLRVAPGASLGQQACLDMDAPRLLESHKLVLVAMAWQTRETQCQTSPEGWAANNLLTRNTRSRPRSACF